MKKLLILVFLSVSCYGYCQQDSDTTKVNAPAESLSDMALLMDLSNVSMPALGDLLDNSKHVAAVRFYDLRKDEESSVLKSTRRNWLNSFRLTANYQYGVMNDLTSFYDQTFGSISQYTGKSNNFYSVGATFAMPILEIYDRKNRINQQKTRIQQTELEAQRTQNEISLLIVEDYTRALQSLALLKSTSEAASVANAQYRVAEKDFINGSMDALGLSRQKNIEAQAIREYEITKMTLFNAILRLEILSNTKILKR